MEDAKLIYLLHGPGFDAFRCWCWITGYDRVHTEVALHHIDNCLMVLHWTKVVFCRLSLEAKYQPKPAMRSCSHERRQLSFWQPTSPVSNFASQEAWLTAPALCHMVYTSHSPIPRSPPMHVARHSGPEPNLSSVLRPYVTCPPFVSLLSHCPHLCPPPGQHSQLTLNSSWLS